MSRENLSVLPTVPTGTSSRKTATCFKVLPAFSPRLTCDSSLSSAIAKKRFADFAETEEGRGTGLEMQANLIGAVKTNRRKTQLCFCRIRCALDGLDRSSFVAADEFDVPVNDHLWCVNAPEAKVTSVSALPFAVIVRGEGILPSDIVPIVHMFTQDDEVRAVYRLGAVQPF